MVASQTCSPVAARTQINSPDDFAVYNGLDLGLTHHEQHHADIALLSQEYVQRCLEGVLLAEGSYVAEAHTLVDSMPWRTNIG